MTALWIVLALAAAAVLGRYAARHVPQWLERRAEAKYARAMLGEERYNLLTRRIYEAQERRRQ